MSIQVIPRGAHRPDGRMWHIGLTTAKSIKRTVTFLPSSRYVLPTEDAQDWNKLFGWSSIRGVHVCSYRFGWRIANDGSIELSAYAYRGNRRLARQIAKVWVMEKTELEIRAYDGMVEWVVNKEPLFVMSGDWDTCWVGLRLGLYFGGDNAAPSDVKVIIEK